MVHTPAGAAGAWFIQTASQMLPSVTFAFVHFIFGDSGSIFKVLLRYTNDIVFY